MRAEFASVTHLRTITAHAPLIRPRAGPRAPSPEGEGFILYYIFKQVIL